ncbi:MAG: hypothetical protein AB1894_13960 [Chloroflexota bacterium]
MKIYSITHENKFKEYAEIGFQVEHQEAMLETWLEDNPDKIIENGSLQIVGRQVNTNLGSFIDLLAIDRQGDAVVIELKRNRTPRETLAQALEYASFVEKLDIEQLESIFRDYSGDEVANLAQYHREYFGLASDEAVVFNSDQRIVIVGQKITPEILQTSTFLRKKGVRVTCLEFTFFQAEGGLRLLSTNIVVGNEPMMISKVSSGSLPRVSESSFINSLDQYGKAVFGRLLEFAKAGSFPIHWGTKGFSLNVDLEGTHVAFCFGYPPASVYQQSLYTALVGRGGLLSKVNISEETIQSLAVEAQNSGLFQPAGREYKCIINRELSDSEIEWLFSWLTKLTLVIQELGLKGHNEDEL